MPTHCKKIVSHNAMGCCQNVPWSNESSSAKIISGIGPFILQIYFHEYFLKIVKEVWDNS